MQQYPEIPILLTTVLLLSGSLAAPAVRHKLQDAGDRQAKNLAFFDYLQPEMDYEGYGVENDDYEESEGVEVDSNDLSPLSRTIPSSDLSRTIPSRKRLRPRPQYNSPIYYIRLPPQPYMFVPGLGYVSQPPPNPMSQFLNVPVSFISNGKPNGIYQWTNDIQIPTAAPPPPPPTPKPKPVKKPQKPDSTIHRLPGTFAFNGRPDDIFVLRDSYNTLYSDVLQNLYP